MAMVKTRLRLVLISRLLHVSIIIVESGRGKAWSTLCVRAATLFPAAAFGLVDVLYPNGGFRLV